MGFSRAMTFVLLLGSGLSRVAGAQITGLPVRNNGVSTGLMIGGEVGFPNADYGKGTAYGGRAALGLGPIGLSAVISSWNPKGPGSSITGTGGYLNLKVFGGPLVPFSVTLQGGAEYAKVGGTKFYHIPAGLGIALKIPNPALAIKPWIAPRLDYLRSSFTGGDTGKARFGMSGGVDFSLLGGLGFGVSYDRVWYGSGLNPSVLSVGANYALKIPGL